MEEAKSPILDKPFIKFAYAIGGIFLLVIVDLASKWFMASVVLNPPQRLPILPFFDLVLVFNYGISFGMFGEIGPWGPRILSFLTTCLTLVLLVWLWRTKHPYEIIGLALIIGGSIGNIIDRLHDNSVTDFLSLYAGSFYWPVFNGADIFITVGTVFLIVSSVILRENN
jgi:signal peptidase II